MEESEIEAIRQRKMAEMQRHQQQSAQAEEQAKQRDAQKQSILRQLLTVDARERLANVRMAYPDLAETVEYQLIQLAQAGRLQGQVDDSMLRDILRQLTPKQRDITIERK